MTVFLLRHDFTVHKERRQVRVEADWPSPTEWRLVHARGVSRGSSTDYVVTTLGTFRTALCAAEAYADLLRTFAADTKHPGQRKAMLHAADWAGFTVQQQRAATLPSDYSPGYGSSAAADRAYREEQY